MSQKLNKPLNLESILVPIENNCMNVTFDMKNCSQIISHNGNEGDHLVKDIRDFYLKDKHYKFNFIVKDVEINGDNIRINLKIAKADRQEDFNTDENIEMYITKDTEFEVDDITINSTIKSNTLPILIDSGKIFVSQKDFGTNSIIISLKKKMREILDVIN